MSVPNPRPVAVGGAGSGRSAASTADGSATATRTPQGSALGTSQFMSPRLVSAEMRDRRERYARRSQSACWLISDAIHAALPENVEEVAQGLFVDVTTGELHDLQWTRPPRPARCSWRVGEDVAVHADDSGRAHFSGTERCGSIWACPVCSAVIRAERSREIAQAVEAHQAQGGSVVFLTLTLRHKKPDPLERLVDAALSGWRDLMRGRWWAGSAAAVGVRDAFGIEGFIRATEVTYGRVSGWHPHLHVLLFTGESLSDRQIVALGDAFHRRWADLAEKRTGRRPDRQHGVDVQRVDQSGRVLAQYLGKVQDGKWTASAELARGDVKQGRGGDHVAPFQLLDEEVRHGEATEFRLNAPPRALWGEYVAATKGRKAITWSRGLKRRYDVGEKSDEDILDDTESAPPVWVVHRAAYDTARRSQGALWLALGLEAAARGDTSGLARILPGHAPPTPPPERADDAPS